MTVFDSGSFSEQEKLERLESRQTKTTKDWKEGFRTGDAYGYHRGYKAALERYIPVDKE